MRRLALFVSAIVLMGSLPAWAAVKIDKIYYNSPGSDTGSNSSLNAEWIRIKNTGTQSKNLTGWRIKDVSGHLYRFPTTKLGPGKTVTVHTGNGTKRPGHRYWRQDNYVWNNDSDTATLKNKSGSVIDRCHYSSSSASYKVC